MQTMNGGSLLRQGRAGTAARVAAAALAVLFLILLLATSAKAAPPTYSLSLKFAEGGTTALQRPEGVATDKAGNVYVADRAAGRVEKFSSSGIYLAKFGSPGSGPGQLSGPIGVSVDPSGNIWVADKGNQRVAEFSALGAFLRNVTTPSLPVAIANDSAGNAWVLTDYIGAWKISPTGTYLAQINPMGGGGIEGSGLAIDPVGNIWTRYYHGEVYETTSTGTTIQAWKSSSGAGIAADASGNVWLSAVSGCEVAKFTAVGKLVEKFGACGSGPGKLSGMSMTSKFAIGPEGAFWVALPEAHEVQKWLP